MSTRVALIVIGTFKENWWSLTPIARADFVDLVAQTGTAAGIVPVAGYKLTSTPGAFLEVWEAADRATVDRAVKGLLAMGYAQYVEARWLIGERAVAEVTPRAKKKTRRTVVRRAPRAR